MTRQASNREEIEKMLPLRVISKVIRGFGRGSKDLGIPTANLDPKEFPLDDLPCGIYWGWCRIGDDQVYKTACSLGYNPTYGGGNEQKSLEPHLIASESSPQRHASSCGETLLEEFYGKEARLSLVGYLRPELPFEGLEKLIEAIKQDIVDTEKLADAGDAVTIKEKEWVQGNDGI